MQMHMATKVAPKARSIQVAAESSSIRLGLPCEGIEVTESGVDARPAKLRLCTDCLSEVCEAVVVGILVANADDEGLAATGEACFEFESTTPGVLAAAQSKLMLSPDASLPAGNAYICRDDCLAICVEPGISTSSVH
mmetsp:Transcript_6324/g.15059  ORF Transcript_6324/g.15059 Transcript_6324/m.15059 type:complete len:137 (-) Transcript_6324:1421-1831(-)